MTLIRYPERHPHSRIGLNAIPVGQGSQPVNPVNPVSEQHTIAADIGHVVEQYQEQRRSVKHGGQENRPLDSQMPPSAAARPCEFCAEAGYRDANGKFPIAEFEITSILHSSLHLACRHHMLDLRTLRLITRIRQIERRASPVLGGSGIGDVPVSLAISHEAGKQ